MALLSPLLLRCFAAMVLPGKRYSCEDVKIVLRISLHSVMAFAVDSSIGSRLPKRRAL
jgi:hypothetical protein